MLKAAILPLHQPQIIPLDCLLDLVVDIVYSHMMSCVARRLVRLDTLRFSVFSSYLRTGRSVRILYGLLHKPQTTAHLSQ